MSAIFDHNMKRISSMLLLVLGLVGVGQPLFAEPRSMLHGGPSQAELQVEGTLHVLWGDPPPGQGGSPQHIYQLQGDDGGTRELILDEATLHAAGGLARLHRKRVAVHGRLANQNNQVVFIDSLAASGDPLKAADLGPPAVDAMGSQPYIWILARFLDDSSTPEQEAWFLTQAGSTHPGLDHFWREVSYNNINLVGSDVVGWYNLPEPRSHYVHDIDGDGDLDVEHDLLLNDCVSLADADVHFPTFVGINLIFNGALDCCAWGGSRTRTIDGVTKTYGVTWMPPVGWRDHGVLAHEMGHALGLPHSSGPYDATYDSQWDVMSAAHGTCAQSDPVYGCLGTHTIAYHKNMLSWIPSGRRFEMGSSPDRQTLTLHDLAVSAPDGRLHLIRLPWYATDPSQFYTLERRRQTGYDANIPGEGVILHAVDPSRGADVVDPDGDGDCNDEGAIWRPGETFHDATNNITMTVLSADSDSSVVTVTNAAHTPVYVNLANSGTENGSMAFPWNTVAEGQADVLPGGTVYIAPGTYSASTVLCRPATFTRNGSSGVVTIGP